MATSHSNLAVLQEIDPAVKRFISRLVLASLHINDLSNGTYKGKDKNTMAEQFANDAQELEPRIEINEEYLKLVAAYFQFQQMFKDELAIEASQQSRHIFSLEESRDDHHSCGLRDRLPWFLAANCLLCGLPCNMR